MFARKDGWFTKDLLCVQYYLEKVGVSPHTPHIKMNIKPASCSTTVCSCMIVSAGFGADLYHVTCKFSITERLSVAELWHLWCKRKMEVNSISAQSNIGIIFFLPFSEPLSLGFYHRRSDAGRMTGLRKKVVLRTIFFMEDSVENRLTGCRFQAHSSLSSKYLLL